LLGIYPAYSGPDVQVGLHTTAASTNALYLRSVLVSVETTRLLQSALYSPGCCPTSLQGLAREVPTPLLVVHEVPFCPDGHVNVSRRVQSCPLTSRHISCSIRLRRNSGVGSRVELCPVRYARLDSFRRRAKGRDFAFAAEVTSLRFDQCASRNGRGDVIDGVRRRRDRVPITTNAHKGAVGNWCATRYFCVPSSEVFRRIDHVERCRRSCFSIPGRFKCSGTKRRFYGFLIRVNRLDASIVTAALAAG